MHPDIYETVDDNANIVHDTMYFTVVQRSGGFDIYFVENWMDVGKSPKLLTVNAYLNRANADMSARSITQMINTHEFYDVCIALRDWSVSVPE